MLDFFKHIKLSKTAKTLLLSIVLFATIAFSFNNHAERRVKNVIIEIDRTDGQYFVEEHEIENIINANGTDPIVDKKYKHLQLKDVEKKIKSFNFVHDAQVSKDHKGNLMVFVQQRKPIARIITAGTAGMYICSDGYVISTSPKFTSRVLTIDGEYVPHIATYDSLNTEQGKKYLDLLNYIDKNTFWRAQAAHLYIDQYGEVTIIPQVGKQLIEIGLPEQLDEKFRNAELFYKKIIPAKGWDAYSKVNVKFKNQIICSQ
ncbi:MAG: cell division protein FtsQ [Cytophagaceae bacterium]|nr:cell division protein FtsQ [Cytophagaceae bacterium]MDW8455416.1 cell division protein FtsQ [Cytophagaceae bacterium]